MNEMHSGRVYPSLGNSSCLVGQFRSWPELPFRNFINIRELLALSIKGEKNMQHKIFIALHDVMHVILMDYSNEIEHRGN